MKKLSGELKLLKEILDQIDLDDKPDIIINSLGASKGILDNMMHRLVDEETKKCEHPPEYRINLTTMGMKDEKWKCNLCGLEWSENDADKG